MKPKRITAFLLSVAMTISLLPTFTLTALADETTTTTTTEKNITLGASALKGKQQSNVWFGNYQQSEYTPVTAPESPTNHAVYTDSDGTKFVYLSKTQKYYKVEPVKWHVLDTDNDYNRDAVEGETDTTRSLFLLSDSKIEQFKYNKNYAEVTWETSGIRSWLNGYTQQLNQENKDYSNDNFINAAFSDEEKNVIAETNVLNNEYNGIVYGGNDTNDKIFLLSRNEVQDSKYGLDTKEARVATSTDYILGGGKAEWIYKDQTLIWYWLRSPGINRTEYTNGKLISSLCWASSISASGYLTSDEKVRIPNHARPAFNIDVNSVLFTTPAVNGKNIETGVDKPTSYEGTDYKLTVLDSDRKFKVSDSDKRKGTTDKKITVGYSGATVGSNEYISAILTAENSNDILYYGQITNVKSESGTITLTLPSELAEGKYTLKLFNEQINGDYKTDFSSAFSDIDLTIGLAGNGTETDLYLIHTLSDLEYFIDKVNDGTYQSAYVKLMADIDASSLTSLGMGSKDKKYAGTFDGNGHKITVSLSGDTYTALFPYVNGATIKNLTVDGSITTSDKFAAGIVGYSSGNTTLENCMSLVAINSSVSGDGTHGGLVANAAKGSLTIDNCAFVGTIKGENTQNCGGLVGWAAVETKISNSYVAANFAINTSGSSNTIARNPGKVKISNCYYTNVLGYDGTNAEYVSEEQVKNGELAYKLNGSAGGGEKWYQNIDKGTKDNYPVPNKMHGIVYYGYVNCAATNMTFTNTYTKKSIQGHTGGTATCLKARYCADCGATYLETDPTAHETKDTYCRIIDDTEHGIYHSCCNALIEKEKHKSSAEVATCTGVAKCDICKSSYGGTDGTNHTGTLEWVDNGYGEHEYKYNCCGLVTETAKHNLEYSVDDTDTIGVKCTVCADNSADNWSIGQGTVTLQVSDKVYDGKSVTASYRATGFMNNWRKPAEISFEYCCEGGCKTAGTHTVTMHVGDKEVTKEFTITQKSLRLQRCVHSASHTI